MYSIQFDAERRILRLTLEGFWSSATLARFVAELVVRATAIRIRHGGFAVLSDATGFPVQSGEVADRFARIMARGAQMNVGPTAIVVASMLSKLQVERTLKGERVRAFLNMDEARRWLGAEWRGGARS